MNKNYPFELFYLAHLLISADVIDKKEETALMRIKSKEQIANNSFREFSNNVRSLKEKEIYQQGIEMLNKCSDSEKLSAFVHLYKMSEVESTVQVKEVRLLLYSIRMVAIEFKVMVEKAKATVY